MRSQDYLKIQQVINIFLVITNNNFPWPIIVIISITSLEKQMDYFSFVILSTFVKSAYLKLYKRRISILEINIHICIKIRNAWTNIWYYSFLIQVTRIQQQNGSSVLSLQTPSEINMTGPGDVDVLACGLDVNPTLSTLV